MDPLPNLDKAVLDVTLGNTWSLTWSLPVSAWQSPQPEECWRHSPHKVPHHASWKSSHPGTTGCASAVPGHPGTEHSPADTDYNRLFISLHLYKCFYILDMYLYISIFISLYIFIQCLYVSLFLYIFNLCFCVCIFVSMSLHVCVLKISSSPWKETYLVDPTVFSTPWSCSLWSRK